jgi:ABC-2 type transport system permease protein
MPFFYFCKKTSFMLAIFQKEISTFFSSLMAYIVMAVFVTATGLLLWVFPDSSILNYGFADLGTFFYFTPYILLFLIPAITMRAFAEEVRTGTIELLLTKPLGDGQLVWGKFLANWSLALLTLLPTLVYFYSVYQLGNPVGNIDIAAVAGSYLGLALLSGVFVAIGLWSSSLTDNQIVAFVIAVFVCFLLYVGIGAIAKLDIWGQWSYWLAWLALDEQYNALGKGLIDSRNVIFLSSLVILFLWLTRNQILGRRT